MKKQLKANRYLSLIIGAGCLVLTTMQVSAEPAPYSPASTYNGSSYSNSRASSVPSYTLSRPEVNIKSFSNTPNSGKSADGYQPSASLERIHNQDPAISRFKETNEAQNEDESASGFYKPVDRTYNGRTKAELEQDGVIFLEGSDT